MTQVPGNTSIRNLLAALTRIDDAIQLVGGVSDETDAIGFHLSNMPDVLFSVSTHAGELPDNIFDIQVSFVRLPDIFFWDTIPLSSVLTVAADFRTGVRTLTAYWQTLDNPQGA